VEFGGLKLSSRGSSVRSSSVASESPIYEGTRNWSSPAERHISFRVAVGHSHCAIAALPATDQATPVAECGLA
jgi:hypothetical protein